MADYTVTIGSPTLSGSETFSVSYQKDSGPIVFFGNETNSPFVIDDLDAGSYKLYIELNGQTVVYCFTIANDCTCPTISNVQLVEVNGLWYINADFDLPDGLPPCGLNINYSGNNGDSGNIFITSLSELIALVSGTTYRLSYFPAGQNTNYTITIAANCCNDNPVPCGTYNIFQTCDPPQAYPPHAPYFYIYKDGSGNYFMRVTANTAGNTCHTFTVTYNQLYVTSGTPDSGLYNGTVSTSGSFPKLIDIPLSPNPDFDDPFMQGQVRYSVEYTDCCGNHGYGTVVQNM